MAPDERTRGSAGWVAGQGLRVPWVRRALNALAGAPFFADVSQALMIFALRQVRRYFSEPELRGRIRARVAAEIGADTAVVVGHSLGSVVAYEALCDPVVRAAHPEWAVRSLVTVGSPLGVSGFVFDRLEPTPESPRV